MSPSYSPAVRTPPGMVTCTVPDCPGGRSSEDGVTVGVKPGSRPTTVKLNVSSAVPVLVMVRVWFCVALPSATPKLKVAGTTAASAFIEAFTSISPAPASITRACGQGRPVVGTAGREKSYMGALLLTRKERYCAAVQPGRAAFKMAAAPAIMGADPLVPSAG